MGIHYSTTPRNFEELCDSVRGQVERSRELSMRNEEIPFDEMVTITSESFLSILDRIEMVSDMVAEQARLFIQIETMFRWVFSQLGVDIDELIADSEDAEDEGY